MTPRQDRFSIENQLSWGKGTSLTWIITEVLVDIFKNDSSLGFLSWRKWQIFPILSILSICKSRRVLSSVLFDCSFVIYLFLTHLHHGWFWSHSRWKCPLFIQSCSEKFHHSGPSSPPSSRSTTWRRRRLCPAGNCSEMIKSVISITLLSSSKACSTFFRFRKVPEWRHY